ncbi:MAG: GntR family transcriptional regulator [Acidimicrobiales bacterium]
MSIHHPLDRRNPLPLWAQLLEDLRRRLSGGGLDRRFPTDAQLMAEYGVSRQTVREAVRRLVDEGRLERTRGRGTEIRPPEFEQPLDSLYSLVRLIESRGASQGSVVRVLEERTQPHAARRLGLADGAALVFLERLRLAAGRPLSLEQAWLPADLARPLLGADLSHAGLYDELARRCGVIPEGGREQLRAVVPAAEDRRALQMQGSDAALAVDRLTWTSERRVELRHSLVRGDRYGLVGEWSASGGSKPLELAALHRAEP